MFANWVDGMAHIIWRERMSVGIGKIDDDHRAIISYVNELDVANAAEYFDERKVARIVLSLFEYTREHFSREEKLMLAIDYPDFDSHKKQHDDVRRKLHDIGLTFMQSPTRDGSARIQEFVSEWLVKHIILTDTKITPFVR